MLRIFFTLLVMLSGQNAVEAQPANVLLICVDDLKPTIRCFGDHHAVTPNIDRLAKAGVRFDAAYCNQAVCAPSRNALMTGLRPQTIGVYDLATHFRRAAPDVVTFSQHFIKHGYHASALGKIYHIGHGNTDDEMSWSMPSWRSKASSYALPASLANTVKDASGKKRGPATEAADVPDDTYRDGEVAIEAAARLSKAAEKPDQPFFLAVGFLKPHLPFVAPQKYWDLYDPDFLPMPSITVAPEGAPSYATHPGGELRNYSDMPNKGDIDATTTRHLIHGYYAATSYADAQIGRVLDTVDELGLTDNTIIVLWGDHGWHLGDHGIWCKHTNFEQAARIPVIISAPGGAAGASTTAMIETVDLFPTVAQLAGIELPANIDGISQAEVVKHPEHKIRDYVTHVYPRGGHLGRAIRDQRYRMVEWTPLKSKGEVDIELYDYQADPLETKNIAADHADIVKAMRSTLAKQSEPKLQWKGKPTNKASAGSKKNSTHGNSSSAKPFDRQAAFTKRDADKDGFLTLKEFISNQKDVATYTARFPRFDKNGDGKLSAEEYVGRK